MRYGSAFAKKTAPSLTYRKLMSLITMINIHIHHTHIVTHSERLPQYELFKLTEQVPIMIPQNCIYCVQEIWNGRSKN